MRPHDTTDFPGSLLLVGAGKMGGAMLQGWLARGLDAARVAVREPHPSEELTALAGATGLHLNPTAFAQPEAVVLGIKPQGLEAAAADLAPLVGPDTLVISIMAGKTVADIVRALPAARAVVRAMPNLPASIGRGATGIYASPDTTARQRALTETLLGAVGIVEWLDREDLVDAVTAVSGSGPAYVFHLVECLAEAARQVGLDPGAADRLARQTVIGAAELLSASGQEPAILRQNVTSPGGTTAAALEILAGEGGLAPLMARAVEAAKRRATELSGASAT